MKVPKKTKDKVIILGTAPSWEKAPLGDPKWEAWGLGNCWQWWGKYATRWFEIHPMSLLLKLGWNDYRWLTECPIPIYMAKHYAKVPNSIPFPLADVGGRFLRQFSSTFCYELALAIHEGFETIGIYGITFSGGTLRERFIESRGVLYWLGVAAGRGIKIQFPDAENKEFTHPYLYGLECWQEADFARKEIALAFLVSAYSIVDGLGLTYSKFRGKGKYNVRL